MADGDLAAPTRRGPRTVIYVAIGLAAGFCSGLFGVGGGLLIVPGLMLLAQYPQRRATGTSLLALTPVSVVGLASYSSHGAFDWPTGLALAIGMVGGGFAGTRIAARVPAPLITLLFCGLLITAGIRLLAGEPTSGERTLPIPTELAILVAVGVMLGILSGLVGAGSGVLIVPILVLGLGFPSLVAKGVSMFAVFPNGLIAGILHARRGNVDARAVATIGASGAVSVFVGSILAVSIDDRLGSRLFALLLFAIAAQLGVRTLRRLRGGAAT